jgi:hypothetical protein
MTEPKAAGGPVCIFYGTIHDVEVVINIPGKGNTKGRLQAVIEHIRAIPNKAKNIESLDGLPALLKKIEMTGTNHVEKVNVTYEQNEREIVRTYAVDQFYKL